MQHFKNRFLISIAVLLSLSLPALAQYDYPSQFTMKKMKLVLSTQDCYISDFVLSTSYPQAPSSFEVVGKLYRPKKKNFLAPVVVLFPPVGGTNVLDKDMAETFCSNNVATFIPTTDFTGIDQEDVPPVEDHDHALLRIVATTKAFIAYSRASNRLDGNKVGVMGASLGGIVSSFTMGALPELSAGYFIVSGGDIPFILAHSQQERVVRVKEVRRKEVGFRTDDEYEEWLRTKIHLDPLDLANNVPAEMVQMVISDNDTSVPTSTQFLLNQRLGNPAYQTSSSDHFWTVVNSMSGSNLIAIKDFFTARFKKKNTRLP